MAHMTIAFLFFAHVADYCIFIHSKSQNESL